MAMTTGLSVRQFERHGLQYQAELVIADEHSPQVRFSPSASSSGPHAIRGQGVDLSVGGAGLECRSFVPRLCSATLRILQESAAVGRDGAPILDVIFEHPVKVRRVYMLSNAPTYGVGLAFINPDPSIEQRVLELKARITARQTAAPSGGSPSA